MKRTEQVRTATARHMPITRWIGTVDRDNLRRDIVAGVVVAALLVPQSLGYARVAGVPVEVGLYAVPLALLAYAVFGSSQVLIVGPASSVAAVSASLVVDLADPGDTAQAIAVTGGLAIAAGVVLVAVGLARLGWVGEFLSKPIVTGFVFGLTLTIVVSQVPTLLGLPRQTGDLLDQVAEIFDHRGLIDFTTALVGAGALVMLFGGSWLAPRLPWSLLTLLTGIVASNVVDLAERGVAVVGEVPRALPPLGLPALGLGDLTGIVVGGLSIALVGLAESLSAARLFATKEGGAVDTDQELAALGMANVAAGISGGMSVAGSLSKTAAGARAGSRSQVTGVVAAVLVLVVLGFATGVVTDLPDAVLAAIVVHAVWKLMDVATLDRYRRIRRADFVAALVALLGVVLFGPLIGLGIAIGISLLGMIYRTTRADVEVMGKIHGEKAAWGRIAKHPDREEVPGVVVVRLGAPLFWANAAEIKACVLREVASRPGTRAAIVDLEATTQLDTTSVDELTDLLDTLEAAGVQLYLVRVFHSAHSVLRRAGFLDRLGDEHVWHSISQGVRAARKELGLKHPDEADETETTIDEERIAARSEPSAPPPG